MVWDEEMTSGTRLRKCDGKEACSDYLSAQSRKFAGSPMRWFTVVVGYQGGRRAWGSSGEGGGCRRIEHWYVECRRPRECSTWRRVSENGTRISRKGIALREIHPRISILQGSKHQGRLMGVGQDDAGCQGEAVRAAQQLAIKRSESGV